MTLNYIQSFFLHTFAFPLAHKMVALSSLLWEDRHVSTLGRQAFFVHTGVMFSFGFQKSWTWEHMGPTSWTWETQIL